MFVHADGSVTGSVNHAQLEKLRKAAEPAPEPEKQTTEQPAEKQTVEKPAARGRRSE